MLRLRYAVAAACGDDVAALQHAHRCVDDVATALGGCKRVHSTPIPPTYVRHASRALLSWLLCLPLALSPLHATASGLACTTGLTAFLILGIEEIGMQIEEPFAVLPLHDLSMELSERAAAIVDGPAPPGCTW